MKCAMCDKDFPLPEMIFVPAGKHERISMQCHDAKCKTCARKIPIDQQMKGHVQTNR